MLTKNNAKFIKSLQLKKFRQKEALFIVEGEKNTLELLNSAYKVKTILGSEQFLSDNHLIISKAGAETIEVTDKQLASLGSFKSNDKALAVVHIPTEPTYERRGIQLVLDDIRDPGNLGTIIRIADWYGIKSIICSETTAELFNPKTISASMGSIFRINVFRRNLEGFFKEQSGIAVYGALLNGDNIHKTKFDKEAYIVIGNESNGIRETLLSFIEHPITIPKLGGAESLNAAMATAIICDNIFREA
ncbi:RNA methyltransferase [Marivirga atlantica]|uniref:RNA methyltransferase n=1 Tax=Marivirga atlantica TaxID=1548457 RepID=A0A937AIB9_9BACT|nr:RNA methyltransferase [Marivirga atlantica]MBL0766703.1 RNA methyltransferase [Marivirga atlantica]